MTLLFNWWIGILCRLINLCFILLEDLMVDTFKHWKINKKIEVKEKKEAAAKKRIATEVKKLQAKQVKLKTSTAEEKHKIDKEISELQKAGQ